MPRTRKRLRIATGISRNGPKGSYEIRVMVGRQSCTDTMPPDSTLAELKARRDALKAEAGAIRPRADAGTLRADTPKYLRLIAHLASADDRADHLEAWNELYGDVLRHRLTSADVLKARVRWLSIGRPEKISANRKAHRGPLSPKTVNHYCDTLRHLFHVLDGRRAPTPCDDVTHLPAPSRPIQRIPEALMIAVDQKLQEFEQTGRLRNAKQRARYRVLVSCGKRHSEVMRAKPEDVDLERRVWVVRDSKGGYTPGGLYLNTDQLAAWRLFVEANAWGPFSHASFTRVLREAGWPETAVVYQARHNTWIAASERGADLADIAAGAGHTDMRLTRKTYVPVLNSRMQQLGERLDGRFGGWAPIRVPDLGPDDNS